MTLAEAAGRYSIPPDILQEYLSLGFAPGGTVDDADLERLGTLIALHDLGLTAEEAGKYLRLTEAGGCCSECLRILDRRRAECLDDIHRCESQLSRLDYLRHELRRGQDGK